jgi:ribonuclease P protein component
MLQFKNRLAQKKDIFKVQKQGQAYFSRKISIKILKTDLNQARIGFIASAKNFPKATERNQVKRLLREIFRQELPLIKKNLDILVFARKQEKEKLRGKGLKKEVREVLKKAGLLINFN